MVTIINGSSDTNRESLQLIPPHVCMSFTPMCFATLDWNSFIAAIIGGLIGGGFAIWAGILAGNQAHRNNLRLDERQKRKRIDAVLQAIQCELEILGQTYKQNIGGDLEKIKEGQTFDVYFSLKQQYFIVYPNNTDVVGQIEDGDLVKAIVGTYNTANVLIESYLINNSYLERLRELQGLTTQALSANRIKQAERIKIAHAKLIGETNNLIAKIENFRRHHPIKPLPTEDV